MPDSLLAGNLAQRALEIFEQYGDVYQTAGAWRTLSEAYRSISDYQSALVCLENALKRDTAINAAPDLVASIREQLSIVYAAIRHKATIIAISTLTYKTTLDKIDSWRLVPNNLMSHYDSLT